MLKMIKIKALFFVLLLGLQPVLFQKTLSCFELKVHQSVLAGKISGNLYEAYSRLFLVEVPAVVEKSYTEDYYVSPNSAGVAFFNDYGFSLKVDVDELPPEVTSLIASHPEIKEEILDALFYDKFIPQLRTLSPDLEIMFEEKRVLDSGEPTLYAVINFPQAAEAVNKATGKPLDLKQGYLFRFANNAFLVNLNMQDALSLMPYAKDASGDLKARLLKNLLRIESSLQIRQKAISLG